MTWKAPLRRLLLRLLTRLSDEQVRDLLHDLLRRRAAAAEPKAGLRLLFELEDDIRREQDRLAIILEGGLHPKHRLTRYHDFFVQRVRPGERVLDVGCGHGAVARDLAERAGAHVLGLDLDPGNIARAQREFAHPRVRYRVGDVTADLPAERFDVIVLSNVLEHLRDRAELLARLAAAGPRAILIRVPLLERDWRVALRRELGARWKLDSTHEIEYTPETFAAETREAGLRVTHREIRWGEIWAEAVSAGRQRPPGR